MHRRSEGTPNAPGTEVPSCNKAGAVQFAVPFSVLAVELLHASPFAPSQIHANTAEKIYVPLNAAPLAAVIDSHYHIIHYHRQFFPFNRGGDSCQLASIRAVHVYSMTVTSTSPSPMYIPSLSIGGPQRRVDSSFCGIIFTRLLTQPDAGANS